MSSPCKQMIMLINDQMQGPFDQPWKSVNKAVRVIRLFVKLQFCASEEYTKDEFIIDREDRGVMEYYKEFVASR